MKYLSDDGKVFDNYTDCNEYEKEIFEKKKNQKRRLQEVEDARKKYHELLESYEADYPDETKNDKIKVKSDDFNDLIKMLF